MLEPASRVVKQFIAPRERPLYGVVHLTLAQAVCPTGSDAIHHRSRSRGLSLSAISERSTDPAQRAAKDSSPRHATPASRVATNAQSRRVCFKRFVRRHGVGFENAFTTTNTRPVIKSNDARDERVRDRAHVFNDQANVRHWRIRRTVQSCGSQGRFERGSARTVKRNGGFAQRHTPLRGFSGRCGSLRVFKQCAAQNNQEGSEFFHDEISSSLSD